MRFVCLPCDTQMVFDERAVGDGTFTASFRCPVCERGVAMLANPSETQMVSSLGVKIGGATLDDDGPMAGTGTFLDAEGNTGSVRWSAAALQRLDRVPPFVRGMVKRVYFEWARDRAIEEITPEVMDTARTDLGLEGM